VLQEYSDLTLFLETLDVDNESLAEQIMQWSNINSGSMNVPGLERMSAVLTEAFSALKCEGSVMSLPPLKEIDKLGYSHTMDMGPMLRFWKRPKAPVQVLLTGHMDTVFGLEHPFQKAVRTQEHTLNGPGVADMKGGLCIMLHALKAFEKSPWADRLGWEVLINPDEEIGSHGSASFFEERAKAHHVGLLFEPAMDVEGTLAGARKGSGLFTWIVRGRAAHAGRAFAEGRNAITLLAAIINRLDHLNGQQEGLTINVGHIRGGGATNIVPDLAIARIDVRIQAREDAIWLQNKFSELITEFSQKEGFTIELHGGFTRIPKLVTGKTLELYELVKKIGEEIGQTITWKPSGGCCDGNNLSAAGLPNIDTLGVCGGNIHSDKEFLKVDTLLDRVKLTTAILVRLSERGFSR
jgi:glutamate carboxypeptidase